MPVYLAHGFKWPRDGLGGIRAHWLIHNLEDLAGEYLQSEQAASVMLQSLRQTYPDILPKLEDTRTGRTLHFIEQYNPDDEYSDTAASQDFCFVVDRLITIAAGPSPVYPNVPPPLLDQRNGNHRHRPTTEERPKTSNGPAGARSRSRPATAKARASKPSSPIPAHDITALSVNLDDVLSNTSASSPEQWAAFAELRDQLAEGEKIGWWIIYNGDPARNWISDSESQDLSYYEDETTEGSRTPTQSEPYANTVLGLPLPSLLPANFRPIAPVYNDYASSIGVAVPHPPPYPPPPPPPLERPTQFADGVTPPRPKSSRSFTNALRRKSSKAHLQPSKNEPVPDLPKLKEMSKKEGFRARFFGRSGARG